MRMMHIILDMELWRLTRAAWPFFENGGTFGAIEIRLLIFAVFLHVYRRYENVGPWRAIIEKTAGKLRIDSEYQPI